MCLHAWPCTRSTWSHLPVCFLLGAPEAVHACFGAWVMRLADVVMSAFCSDVRVIPDCTPILGCMGHVRGLRAGPVSRCAARRTPGCTCILGCMAMPVAGLVVLCLFSYSRVFGRLFCFCFFPSYVPVWFIGCTICRRLGFACLRYEALGASGVFHGSSFKRCCYTQEYGFVCLFLKKKEFMWCFQLFFIVVLCDAAVL